MDIHQSSVSNFFDILENPHPENLVSYFQAFHKLSGTLCAILAISNSLLGENAHELRAELDFLARNKIPRIVPFRGSLIVGDKTWIVVDYHSNTAKQVLSQKGPFSEKEVSKMLFEILVILAHLHTAGKRYAVLNASNIIITCNGDIFLSCFGTSRLLSFPQTIGRGVMQIITPWSAPEEVASDTDANVKSDIWSLGITAIELLNGTHPFVNISYQNLPNYLQNLKFQQNLPLPYINCSEKMLSFIKDCTITDSSMRPTAAELLVHPLFSVDANSSVKPAVNTFVYGGFPYRSAVHSALSPSARCFHSLSEESSVSPVSKQTIELQIPSNDIASSSKTATEFQTIPYSSASSYPSYLADPSSSSSSFQSALQSATENSVSPSAYPNPLSPLLSASVPHSFAYAEEEESKRASVPAPATTAAGAENSSFRSVSPSSPSHSSSSSSSPENAPSGTVFALAPSTTADAASGFSLLPSNELTLQSSSNSFLLTDTITRKAFSLNSSLSVSQSNTLPASEEGAAFSSDVSSSCGSSLSPRSSQAMHSLSINEYDSCAELSAVSPSFCHFDTLHSAQSPFKDDQLAPSKPNLLAVNSSVSNVNASVVQINNCLDSPSDLSERMQLAECVQSSVSSSFSAAGIGSVSSKGSMESAQIGDKIEEIALQRIVRKIKKRRREGEDNKEGAEEDEEVIEFIYEDGSKKKKKKRKKRMLSMDSTMSQPLQLIEQLNPEDVGEVASDMSAVVSEQTKKEIELDSSPLVLVSERKESDLNEDYEKLTEIIENFSSVKCNGNQLSEEKEELASKDVNVNDVRIAADVTQELVLCDSSVAEKAGNQEPSLDACDLSIKKDRFDLSDGDLVLKSESSVEEEVEDDGIVCGCSDICSKSSLRHTSPITLDVSDSNKAIVELCDNSKNGIVNNNTEQPINKTVSHEEAVETVKTIKAAEEEISESSSDSDDESDVSISLSSSLLRRRHRKRRRSASQSSSPNASIRSASELISQLPSDQAEVATALSPGAQSNEVPLLSSLAFTDGSSTISVNSSKLSSEKEIKEHPSSPSPTLSPLPSLPSLPLSAIAPTLSEGNDVISASVTSSSSSSSSSSLNENENRDAPVIPSLPPFAQFSSAPSVKSSFCAPQDNVASFPDVSSSPSSSFGQFKLQSSAVSAPSFVDPAHPNSTSDSFCFTPSISSYATVNVPYEIAKSTFPPSQADALQICTNPEPMNSSFASAQLSPLSVQSCPVFTPTLSVGQPVNYTQPFAPYAQPVLVQQQQQQQQQPAFKFTPQLHLQPAYQFLPQAQPQPQPQTLSQLQLQPQLQALPLPQSQIQTQVSTPIQIQPQIVNPRQPQHTLPPPVFTSFVDSHGKTVTLKPPFLGQSVVTVATAPVYQPSTLAAQSMSEVTFTRTSVVLSGSSFGSDGNYSEGEFFGRIPVPAKDGFSERTENEDESSKQHGVVRGELSETAFVEEEAEYDDIDKKATDDLGKKFAFNGESLVSEEKGGDIKRLLQKMHKEYQKSKKHEQSIAHADEGAGAEGEKVDDSTENASANAKLCRRAQGERCYHCGQKGHMFIHCPHHNKELFISRHSCFRCGRMGHSSKECTFQDTRVCFVCGMRGHISKDCPVTKSAKKLTQEQL
eukprot:MONOS_1589.1-p1 / transcript=MONOS_1589.1 / gene=MONOS_1589 / organism=Monocercomonoides_exilis_PA203 / gene_product=Serine / transcript_product=Serine / location=Mono_scaffold00028:145991-151033(-) / protein_length=1623 / sequence_SO=supercontig / SO=protein_coding / is_pseudo=false